MCIARRIRLPNIQRFSALFTIFLKIVNLASFMIPIFNQEHHCPFQQTTLCKGWQQSTTAGSQFRVAFLKLLFCCVSQSVVQMSVGVITGKFCVCSRTCVSRWLGAHIKAQLRTFCCHLCHGTISTAHNPSGCKSMAAVLQEQGKG